MNAEPLIVTLKLDGDSFARLDALRRAHFPPERNHLPAHVTLFHKLPGEERAAVLDTLAAEAAIGGPLAVQATGLRKLGRGVAVELRSSELQVVRADLAARFAPWLTPQDRQGFRPHVTVQNKVEPAEAAALHDRLLAGFQPFTVSGEGLLLWRYLGGPWALEAEVLFR